MYTEISRSAIWTSGAMTANYLSMGYRHLGSVGIPEKESDSETETHHIAH